MGRKIATIGITINLENYENLRLEVQGEIGPEGTTEDLIQFLDGLLLRLGRGDQATAERVEAYRRRVLSMPGPAAPPAAEAPPAPARKEGEGRASPPRPAPAGPSPEPAPVPREPRKPEVPQEPAPAREEKPATVRVTPETKVTRPPAKQPARPGAPAPAAQAPAERKAQAPPAPQAPREAPKGGAPAAEKPKIAEGEMACEGCGASITRNQEKLSRLLTGKALCKRCMNP